MRRPCGTGTGSITEKRNERKDLEKMRARLEKIEQVRVVYRGLTQAARALGCSRAHLSYVLHGKRKASERLAAKLKRMGVEVEG